MTKKPYFLILTCLFFVITACSTAPKETAPAERLPPLVPPSAETTIDYVALKTALGLDRAPESLGLAEKAFNTCQVGYGYSSSSNCRHLYFTVIHFQLMCRDSEGTVSTGIDNADQRPIANKPVTWTLKGNGGVSETNASGMAQILSVSQNSQRTQRLKLSVGNDFLYMRANEITKVVTPKSWCE